MRFNLAYFGPEALFHLRRDFLLSVKYGLESLGHRVNLSGLSVDGSCMNLIVGAYFLPPAELARLGSSGLDVVHINTEVIAGDLLNFNPQKTDFKGAYLPAMQKGRFVWDVILDNLAEHQRYGTRAHFLRWGWHPRLEDIEHRGEKDLDFYFFGLMSPRRQQLVQELFNAGLSGIADHFCPYFLRNDRIARARVQLNIIQDDVYSHVNSFRVCYLANNRCAIVSEAENDPAGYLDVAVVSRREGLAATIADLCAGGRWKAQGEEAYERFRSLSMKQCMEELLEASFGRGVAAATPEIA